MKVRPKAWGPDASDGFQDVDMKGSFYILTEVKLKEYMNEPRHGKAWGILVHPGAKYAKTFPPTQDYVSGSVFTKSGHGQVKPFIIRKTRKGEDLTSALPEPMISQRIQQALQRKWEHVPE